MVRLEIDTAVGPYRVQRFIKDGLFNGNYCVTDEAGQVFFLKIFDREAAPERLRVDGTMQEIAHSRAIRHPNIVSYVSDGVVDIDQRSYPYLVTEFLTGELLSELVRDGRRFTGPEAKALIIPILEGLVYLNTKCGLNHNDLTPRNILIETAAGGSLVPRIIDLGHAHASLMGAPPFPVEDLNLLYTAPEALNGIFSPQSDAFSVAAILYTMLSGQVPWNLSLNEQDSFADRKAVVREGRKREPVWPAALHAVDPVLQNVVLRGLTLDKSMRPTPERLLEMLGGVEDSGRHRTDATAQASGQTSGTGKPMSSDGLKATTDGTDLQLRMQRNQKKGGFADVAGMDNLKKMLTERVIWVLRDKEKAAKYRLLPPNGMLLYGPPGCGKTYFAEKFAEESHFNYMVVNGSDIGSTYIHGTQGKIAALFQEAAAKAPTVLCFDEFDSFVPARGSEAARHRPEEVNEFLSQLNNCAQKGIFVIGTTNRMDMIDPAVLRKGRLDLQIEVPAPELETRRLMFVHHLKGRPLAEDVDVARLAELTDGYASSDIAFIANDAALIAALADEPISQRHLEDSIRCNPSSLGKKAQRSPIGYK